MIDERLGRVTDSKTGATQPLRHLGFLLMPTRARAETLVERSHLLNRVRAKSHVRAEHSAHLDYFLAVVGDRQVKVHGHRPDFFLGIFGREDAPLHRGELAMRIEELLDRVEVSRRDDQIVVEKHQDFSRRLRDCAILNAALSGARFVQMRKRHAFDRKVRRRRRAVLGDEYLARSRREFRCEARHQPPKRVGAIVRRDNDRRLQGC